MLYAGLGALPGLGAWLWYNAIRYGSPFTLGYTLDRDGTLGFSTPLATGLHGLLFSSGKSVFLYIPLLFLSVTRLRPFLRAHRRESPVVFVPALLTLGVISCWWCWSGDWAWGPRLLAPIFPMLLLPLMETDGNSPRQKWSLRVLAGLGFAIQLAGTLLHESVFIGYVSNRFAYFYRQGPTPGGIRDDLLIHHFVPEFNPIVVQLWFLLSMLLGNQWAQSHYPWKSLNLPWLAPKGNVRPNELNFWFKGGPGHWVALGLLAAATVLSALRLRRSLAAPTAPTASAASISCPPHELH